MVGQKPRGVLEWVQQTVPATQYVKSNYSNTSSLGANHVVIMEGEWCGEAALWMASDIHDAARAGADEACRYTKTVIAKLACEIIELDADKFRIVARRHPTSLDELRRYAQLFSASLLPDEEGLPPAEVEYLVQQVF